MLYYIAPVFTIYPGSAPPNASSVLTWNTKRERRDSNAKGAAAAATTTATATTALSAFSSTRQPTYTSSTVTFFTSHKLFGFVNIDHY
jgi:hypothetical protein